MALTSSNHIGAYDIAAIVLYFIAVFVVGIASMCRSNRGTVSGYFLAGRFMTWLPVGASLFASNIGSEHFVGLAGSGAATGIGVAAFEFNACILLQLLGWVFLPVYISSGVCTLPEYMKKRFGGVRIQTYLSVLSLVLYIFTKISVNLYSGSLFINEALGWNIWFSVMLLLGLTAIITITGGLAAVIYTDTLQFFIMIFGAVTLTILSFIKVGGFSGLLAKYGSSIAHNNLTAPLFVAALNASVTDPLISPSILNLTGNASRQLACSLPSKQAFIMLRGVSDRDMPWLGFLLGQTPASIWYWCADQMMVQRALAAKSLSHAQGATLMAGAIKLLPLFIMVMPGMISRVLYPDEVGCATAEDCFRVCGQRSGCTNYAYPKLVMGILPDGLRGIMLAVMLAALMSDLTSIFNSASTLFTVDIYARVRKTAKNKELMLVGRGFVVVMIVISILWIPVIQEMQGGQLFIYIQVISAYLAPPIAAIYLVAILWKRGNEVGAFSGLMYGLVLGAARMVLDFIWREPSCIDEDTRPWLMREVHYMYFAMFSFASTGLVMIVGSLLTAKPSINHISRLTFWTLSREAAAPKEEVGPNGESLEMINGGTLSTICTKEGDQVNGAYVKYKGDENGRLQGDSNEMKNLDGDECYLGKKVSVKTRIIGVLQRFAIWFCGLEEQKIISEADALAAHGKITNLYQTRRSKIVLSLVLVLIMSTTVVFYCFFSLYFGPIEVGVSPVFARERLNLNSTLTISSNN